MECELTSISCGASTMSLTFTVLPSDFSCMLPSLPATTCGSGCAEADSAVAATKARTLNMVRFQHLCCLGYEGANCPASRDQRLHPSVYRFTQTTFDQSPLPHKTPLSSHNLRAVAEPAEYRKVSCKLSRIVISFGDLCVRHTSFSLNVENVFKPIFVYVYFQGGQ